MGVLRMFWVKDKGGYMRQWRNSFKVFEIKYTFCFMAKRLYKVLG